MKIVITENVLLQVRYKRSFTLLDTLIIYEQNVHLYVI